MKLYSFQSDATKELINRSIKYLSEAREEGIPSVPTSMSLKAPTGSGKTVMIAEVMLKLSESDEAIYESPNGKSLRKEIGDLVHIVIAPNSLHKQHSLSLDRYGVNITNGMRVLDSDMLLNSPNDIHPGDVIVLNWGSINKGTNKLVSGGERGGSLLGISEELRSKNIQIVLYQDEAHHTANSKKSDAVRDMIKPTVVIDITATPKKEYSPKTVVDRQSVVDSGVIVPKIVVESVDDVVELDKELKQKLPERYDSYTLNDKHTYAALRKMQKMNDWYKEEGSAVVALSGIQLPANTRSEPILADYKDTKEDNLYLQQQLAFINEVFGWTVEGGDIAIWLAGRKENLEGIEKYDSKVKVLIFKYAISLGYDNPRMKTLSLLHDTKTKSFATQTLGRVLRQPERKHYRNERLNAAYVYTDKSLFHDVANDDDMHIQFGERVSPLRKDIIKDKDLLADIDALRLDNHHYRRYLIKEMTSPMFQKALHALYPLKNIKSPKDIANTLGLEWRLNKTSKITTTIIEDIDASEDTYESSISGKLSKDNIRVDSEFDELTRPYLAQHTGWTVKNLKTATRKYWNKAPNAQYNTFQRLVLGSPKNKEAFTEVLKKVVNYVIEHNDFPKQSRTPEKSEEKWHILHELKALTDQDNNLLTESDENYLYSLGRPKVGASRGEQLDSKTEREFARSVIPNIRDVIEDKEGRFIGYCKLERVTVNALAIPYVFDKDYIR